MNENWIAPCGLWCGACGIAVAHASGNERLKEKLAPVYGVAPSDMVCEGCRSENRFVFCQACAIRSCTEQKGYKGCFECNDFPCATVSEFPHPVARKVMLRAVPRWRELGTAAWIAEEEARYACPGCGARLMRGQGRCPGCKEPVNPD
ncbi:MAG: DUF3795 domain-containing protein [Deltaproteobacteria bacterium]|nr:DUF3795 domain-containing protein [Deltaproteobacteria bacterium]